jgi:LacI family transcriptional regulator
MSLRLIAHALGLSITTVSRALSDYSDVSEETRRRVRTEAARIGYVPNALARRLQKGRTDSIALSAWVGDLGSTDTQLYDVITATSSKLVELQLDLVLLGSGLDPAGSDAERARFERVVCERCVDGLILVRPRIDDWRIAFLRGRGFPFVILGAVSETYEDVPVIAPDVRATAHRTIGRLVELGHRRIACVTPNLSLQFAAAHLDAFRRAAAAENVTLEVFEGAPHEEGGVEQTTAALERSEGITAFLYLYNRMAQGGLAALWSAGLEPGRDVAVITLGDNRNLPHGRPPMTAVRTPVREMSRHAVDVLVQRIASRPIEDHRASWPTELIVRASDCPIG